MSEDEVKHNAEMGVGTMTLHDDGDANHDGLYWRDGDWPPYPPEQMKKMAEVIENCHKSGLKTVPYFSNHELNYGTKEITTHGEEWGCKPDDQGTLRPNLNWGALMCLKLGWLDFFKLTVDRALKNYPFDGVYFDWNQALYCNNPLHVGKTSNGVSAASGLVAFGLPIGIGRGRTAGTHGVDPRACGTRGPGLRAQFDESHAGGGKLCDGGGAWMGLWPDFHGHAPARGFAPGMGHGGRAAAGGDRVRIACARCVRRRPAAFYLTALVTGVATWPASDGALELFKLLAPLGNLAKYQFQDCRNESVSLGSADCHAAVYSRPDEAWIVAANFQEVVSKVRCIVHPQALPHNLSEIATATIEGDGRSTKLDPAALTGAGQEIALPALGASLIHLRRG